MRFMQSGIIAAMLTMWLVGCTPTAKLPPGKPPIVTEPIGGATNSPSERPAKITIDQHTNDGWLSVTRTDATAEPGPGEVRLSFSKPVRRDEVEQALQAGQAAPVRGLIQWLDDQTLIWAIAHMPPRLDFLLGGAHDQAGLPLPGGIPSLRIGGAPTLVQLDLATQQEQVLATLPPDIWTASLTADGKQLDLQVWVPGTTRSDWQLTDLHMELQSYAMIAGLVPTVSPRLQLELETWVLGPQGMVGMGVRHGDLVLADVNGGRQQVYHDVIARNVSANVEVPVNLAWSADGRRVAALSFKAKEPRPAQDLIAVAVPSGERTVLVPDLPFGLVSPRLIWAPNGAAMLVGNLLINVQTKQYQTLAGAPGDARGLWAATGQRLLYSPQDWGALSLLDANPAKATPLGDGLLVGWAGETKAYVIRWPAGRTRYIPVGQ
jgi:hypothetical protein